MTLLFSPRGRGYRPGVSTLSGVSRADSMSAKTIPFISWATAGTFRGIGRLVAVKDPECPSEDPGAVWAILHRLKGKSFDNMPVCVARLLR